ncbi:hypothetical protein RVF83_15615 [Gordonia rubripertincta]|uniref:Uncharacterized protein n=2 Tax=Gordonia rubripertincta TaxID=36822 RepID=A0AAW6RFL4_GORRU|nr:hypothetical protein [Gordonia rubripertincta]MDG6783226.1 hypothetical protein [Gordonia rubripertincta]NKY62991.1 hypothetical protein [Gordonia rubripertincta]GAB87134.1 hypothetical protein GORBP_095_00050 [Gordonia rubripertincta NBRC 101908]
MDAEYEMQLIKWALRYNAYKRLATDSNQLLEVLQVLITAYERDHRVPDWAGIDLLRGWAFYLVRWHRFSATGQKLWTEHPEILAIVEAINQHPDARKSDRAYRVAATPARL